MADAEIQAAPTEADAAAGGARPEVDGGPPAAESAGVSGAAEVAASSEVEAVVETATESREPAWLRNAREIGGAVVSGTASADAAADDLLSEIQAEFQRERSVAGGETDWARIAAQSESLLRTKVKDIRAAAFLAIAWGRIEEFEGWSRGLAVIAEMLSAHWPQVRPDPAARMRAHAAQYELLLERLTEDCSRLGTPPRDLAERMRDAAERLVAATAGAASASTPLAPEIAAKVKARLERHAAEWRTAVVPPPPPAADPRPSAPAETAAATDQRAAPPPDRRPAAPAAPPADADAAARELPAVRKRLVEIALLLQAGDPFDPEPYALRRAVVWSNAKSLELEPGEDGTLRLKMDGPSSRDLPAARGAISDKDLVACEALAAKKPYWLDASVRMAALLEARGAADAQRTILAQIAALLALRPELRTAKFVDGTPLLSEPLRELPGVATASTRRRAEAMPEGEDAPAPEESPERALERAVAGRSGRARFRAMLEALAHRGDLPAERRQAVLADLLAVVERADLEEWEPPLAAELHLTILDSVKAGSGPDAADLRSRAMRGLARVRPDLLLGSDAQGAAGGAP
jgi:type VI secretion system ImpA/VasJ family protein